MKLFVDPFGTDPADVPETLQMERSDILMKRAFQEPPKKVGQACPVGTSYLIQRLSVVIQCFNAIALHSTFAFPDLDTDGHSRVNIAY